MPFTTEIKGHQRIKDETSLLGVFGEGFSDDEIGRAEVLVVEKSSFNDPGDDFCRFTLKSKSGETIAKKFVGGY